MEHHFYPENEEFGEEIACIRVDSFGRGLVFYQEVIMKNLYDFLKKEATVQVSNDKEYTYNQLINSISDRTFKFDKSPEVAEIQLKDISEFVHDVNFVSAKLKEDDEFRRLALEMYYLSSHIRYKRDLLYDLKTILEYPRNSYIWVVTDTGTYLSRPSISVSLAGLPNTKGKYIIESYKLISLEKITTGNTHG